MQNRIVYKMSLVTASSRNLSSVYIFILAVDVIFAASTCIRIITAKMCAVSASWSKVYNSTLVQI